MFGLLAGDKTLWLTFEHVMEQYPAHIVYHRRNSVKNESECIMHLMYGLERNS